MRASDRLAMMAVSLSGGVEPGARTGTSVGGQPVVLWRGVDGRVRAWADRCPHRGMRLSFGFVRRNQLTCIYHGWSFESGPRLGGPGTGSRGAFAACVAVPAHPAMGPPAKARVPAFGVVEAVGMIWVAAGPGDTALPPDALPHDLLPHDALPHDARPHEVLPHEVLPHEALPHDAAVAGGVHPVRSITVCAPAVALRAALETTLPPGTEIAAGDGPLITFQGPRLRVLAAVQDRGDAAASAHIVTTDPATAVRQALCRWAALVRDHLAAVALP